MYNKLFSYVFIKVDWQEIYWLPEISKIYIKQYPYETLVFENRKLKPGWLFYAKQYQYTYSKKEMIHFFQLLYYHYPDVEIVIE